MTQILFKDFLEDIQVYKSCEQFWDQLIERIANSMGQAGMWHSWIPRQYADGKSIELDGNPICDGRSEQLGRAYRIIQHPAVSDQIEISAWTKIYDSEYAELPRDELVINLSLSDESARLAEKLLCKWMMPGTTRTDMEAFIAKLERQPIHPG
jgi:hypothetical protein